MSKKTRQLLLGLSLPLLVVACSQAPDSPPSSGDLPPGSPYAGGKMYPWTSRLEAPVADPYAAGRAYPWASPRAGSGLAAQGLGGGENFLSDLSWTSAYSAWGPIERDRSNGEQDLGDGRTISIGGQTFARGLGVHADSQIRYALNGQCTTFSAVVGVDDEVGDRGSVRFQVLAGDRVLFDSGVQRGTDGPVPLSVDVTGVQELRLAVTDGGDNGYYDHADWADAKLSCTVQPPRGTAYLSALAYQSATNGWGPVELNQSNGEQAIGDGRPLTIGGPYSTFSNGLGVHANSAITYLLGGNCTTFTAQVGIDEEVGDRGSVTFEVYGDGTKLYDSGVVTGADAAKAVRVDVTGKQELRLVVTNGGDNIDYDHADWADAKVECAATSGSLDSGFGSGGQVDITGLGTPFQVQPDGGILLVETRADARILRRLTPRGSLDATYGTGGQIILPVAGALAVHPDGRIMVVTSTDGAVVVRRFMASGVPDAGYGAGGQATVRFAQPLEVVQALAEPEGRVTVRSSQVVARITPDGQVDSSFGVAGLQRFASDISLADLERHPGGGYALYGTQDFGSNNFSGAYLALLGADGQVQNSSSRGGGKFYRGLSVSVAPDGSIGTEDTQYYSYYFNGLSSDGRLLYQKSTFAVSERPHDVIALPGNKLLVIGQCADRYPNTGDRCIDLMRVNANGERDASFNQIGGVDVPIPVVRGGLLQPDGKYLVFGADKLLRYLP